MKLRIKQMNGCIANSSCVCFFNFIKFNQKRKLLTVPFTRTHTHTHTHAYLLMRDIFFSIWLNSRTDEIDPRPIPYKIAAIRQALTLYSMVSEMPLKIDVFTLIKMFDT